MRFQIRKEGMGVALYEASTAREALLDFVADMQKAAHRPLVVTDDENGEASLLFGGVQYRAVSKDAAT